jgi:CarD family transcriptional regulator
MMESAALAAPEQDAVSSASVSENAKPARKPSRPPARAAATETEVKTGEVVETDAPAAEAATPRPETTRPDPEVRRPAQHGGPTQIPRAMAKAEIFVEGDHVVYPTHGVGKVERIATEEIAGHRLELIHITFEENRMTLRVPVAKARTAGLRKLSSRKQFDEAMAVLKGRARIKRTMWSRRAQEYEAKINSGDPMAIAEVVRDLHRNAGQPDQSFSERQIYESAMDRLAAELAALDGTDKPAAVTKLGDFLKTV